MREAARRRRDKLRRLVAEAEARAANHAPPEGPNGDPDGPNEDPIAPPALEAWRLTALYLAQSNYHDLGDVALAIAEVLGRALEGDQSALDAVPAMGEFLDRLAPPDPDVVLDVVRRLDAGWELYDRDGQWAWYKETGAGFDTAAPTVAEVDLILRARNGPALAPCRRCGLALEAGEVSALCANCEMGFE